MSWSDYFKDIMSFMTPKEKPVVNKSICSIYTMFEKGYTVGEAVIYVRGSRL